MKTSALFDSSSGVKNNDKKELFFTKTCVDGSPYLNVMSLMFAEVPNAQDLV